MSSTTVKEEGHPSLQPLHRVNDRIINVHAARIHQWPESLELPPRFDWRDKMQLQAPLSQGSCGSCWAVALTGMLRDRGNIFRTQQGQPANLPPLSAQYMLDCSRACIAYRGQRGCNAACDGGFLLAGLAHLQEVGTAAEHKVPYTGDCSNSACRRGRPCAGVPPIAYRCQDHYQVSLYDTFGQLNASENRPVMTEAQRRRNELNIMTEIQQRGPVVGIFHLYSDFEPYWRHRGYPRVYELGWQYEDRAERLGVHAQLGDLAWTIATPGPYGLYDKEVHAVCLVGWDVIDNIPCWIARNSWGVDGGQRGYFYIRRGNNTLGIEGSVYACWFTDDTTLPFTNTQAHWDPSKGIETVTAVQSDVKIRGHEDIVMMSVGTLVMMLMVAGLACMAWKSKTKI